MNKLICMLIGHKQIHTLPGLRYEYFCKRCGQFLIGK